MKKGTALAAAAWAAVAGILGGCDGSGDNKVKQTGFPGQVSAGGSTSGEVMARASKPANTPDPSGTPGIPQGAGGNTGGAAMGGTTGSGTITGARPAPAQEGARGQSTAGAPGGTPGIPEGSGGNTSGAGMGGTTGGAAASQAAPAPAGSAPAAPAQEQKR